MEPPMQEYSKSLHRASQLLAAINYLLASESKEPGSLRFGRDDTKKKRIGEVTVVQVAGN